VPINPLRAVRDPAERARSLETLRRAAWALDSMFQVPGINVRFGLDAIVGLIPGVGDLATPLFSIYLLVQAFRMRVPKIVLARMLMIVGIDAVVGLVPVLGDLFDIGWKANMRNLALVEQYADPRRAPTRSDYVFVAVLIVLLICLAILPFVVLIAVLYYTGVLGRIGRV
jgi:hypothetical protein